MILLSTNIAFAGIAPLTSLKHVGDAAGFDESQNSTSAMAEFIGIIVQTFLSILGIIFVILILYAGYKWMMAQGEEKNIEQAKHTIQRSIIGLIIILGAFAIWNLLLSRLLPTY